MAPAHARTLALLAAAVVLFLAWPEAYGGWLGAVLVGAAAIYAITAWPCCW